MGTTDDVRRLRERRTLEAPSRPEDYRTQFERDYDRVIQAPSFRRLQGKSQLFGAGFGDYYRTRLTHSIEVAQIARDVVHFLWKMDGERLYSEVRPGLILDGIVVECAALLHDIGHPPFGHHGEYLLNIWLNTDTFKEKHKGPGCFEGNAQNFRWLMFLENGIGLPREDDTFNIQDGLNLTHALLLAVNKYPCLIGQDGARKGVYRWEWQEIEKIRAEWEVPQGRATLEAQVMDYCDDIAYSTHDIEDGVKAGLVGLRVLTGEDARTRAVIQDGIVDIIMKTRKDKPHWQNLIHPTARSGAQGDALDLDEAVIRDEVDTVLDGYLCQWKNMIKKCTGDVSMASREIKARQVHEYITSLRIVDNDGWRFIQFMEDLGNGRLTVAHRQERKLDILKQFAYVAIVDTPDVQREQYKSNRVLDGIIMALGDEGSGKKIIPATWVQRHKEVLSRGVAWDWTTLVMDYVAGMTDGFAVKFFASIHG